jgi:amino acid adenylation domain-containing protein
MEELIFQLKEYNISVAVVDGNLSLKIPKGLQVPEIVQNIKANKEALISFINAKNKAGTIPKAELRPFYPLSSIQSRMFFIHEMDKTSTVYNLPRYLQLEGALDVDKIEKSIQSIVNRHDILRTYFELTATKPIQKVVDFLTVKIEQLTVEETIEKTLANFIKPFDLNKLPLLRVGLVKLEDTKHILIIDMHHIISDGSSYNIIVEDFMMLYNDKALVPLTIQYKDFTVWQQSLEYKQDIEKQKAFWLQEFEEEIEILNLPAYSQRPLVKENKGETIAFGFNEAETKQLKTIAEDNKTTIYTLLLTNFYILLSKLTNQEDVIIGTTIAGRQHISLQKVVGMFVNTLPLRNYPKGELTYKQFLEQVKIKTRQAFKHQDFSYAELINELKVERDLSRNPIFDVLFNFNNFTNTTLEIPGLSLTPYNVSENQSMFDLALNGHEENGEIILQFKYDTAIYNSKTINTYIGYFKKLVKNTFKAQDSKLSELEIVSSEEHEHLLKSLDFRDINYPKDKTIHQLFEEQAAQFSEKIAIRFKNEAISYKTLNEKANQLARILREQGVKNNDIVVLFVERSLDVVVGMLAILKAGGAYLPIDVEYPKERQDYLLINSQAKFILTSKDTRINTSENSKVITINYSEMASYSSDNINNSNKLSDLAYIIYTSGTTGDPKGVQINHNNVVRLFKNEAFQFSFSSSDIWTLFHSHCFDFSVWEIYGALLFGGQLIIVPREETKDTFKFLKLLQEEKVTILNQTPSAFYNLIEASKQQNVTLLHLKYVIFGGEALTPIKLKDWAKLHPNAQLINMYGITETTVHVTYKEIKAEDLEKETSNIGKPIPTLSVYILNKNLRLVPKGTPGELFIAGEGISKGYLNNKTLTESKFITNPFDRLGKLYRTGDWARQLPNDDLEYLGRIDSQVKIRGYRIELGEIDGQLSKYEAISKSITLVKERDSGKQLVTYYIAERALDELQLKMHLSNRIPEYMIPTHFIHLDKIPLTPNGKLNKKALPEVEIIINTKTISPVNDTQKALTEIWSNVLSIEIEKIGVNTNFFDLGGDSINILILTNQINKKFDCNITITDIFGAPTIENIERFINNENTFIEQAKEAIDNAINEAEDTLNLLDGFID